MKYPKLKVGETPNTHVMESPITEADILQMAQQLGMYRLSKGRALTERRLVFSHLETLLQFHDYEVFVCYYSISSTGLSVSESFTEALWKVPACIHGKWLR